MNQPPQLAGHAFQVGIVAKPRFQRRIGNARLMRIDFPGVEIEHCRPAIAHVDLADRPARHRIWQQPEKPAAACRHATPADFGGDKAKQLAATDLSNWALGSFATVYAYGPAVKDIMAVISQQNGVDVVLNKKDGCARFELPEDRMGDIIVVSGGPKGSKVLGTSRDKHDLSGLNEPLRSHGGLTEQEIPVIANRKFKNLPATLRNFDAFALGCNNIVEA